MAPANLASVAYYTVVEDERTGWTGGLLHLSPNGRPVEFQCTLPVRTTRTHEILYGTTLRQHLIADIIGPILVRKARTPITLLCCDQPEAIELQSSFDFPVALVREAAEGEDRPFHDESWQGSATTKLGNTHLRVAIEQLPAAIAACESMQELPDALEPLERIREAIKEAHSQIAHRVRQVESTESKAA
ncbi:MAG: hypothetical protein VYA84_16505 [Planctomycetota bacterium]|nr:hypothetical protein [Planctomycetota bacterium]